MNEPCRNLRVKQDNDEVQRELIIIKRIVKQSAK
ncbi:Uncharacterised protein [Serratia fonticola]|nr:Uncharacterised protein [Serratia fonticola]